MLTAARRTPVAFGVKVTLIVHDPPAATIVPQVLVWEKSAAFAPVIRNDDMVSVPKPVLVSVMFMGKLLVPTFVTGNCNIVGDKFTTGCTPKPLNATVCGLPVALSVILSVPLRWPSAVGENVTVIWQLAPPARLEPHPFVWAKSPGFVPPIEILLIVTALVLVLVKVTILPGLVECRFVLPNDSDVGLTVTVSLTPVPVSDIDCGLPGALSFTVTNALRGPVVVGVNVTWIVQLAPGATLLPQLLV